MIYQSKPWMCGPAAIVNALRAIGLRVTEKSIARAAGTTKEQGTDSPGMLKALNTDFTQANAWDITDEYAAEMRLQAHLLPVIICVQGWQHWVVVIGRVGSRFIVFDSENTKKNRRTNGVYVLNWRQLKKMWRKETAGVYSGISVRAFDAY